jgi:hypothetical protein
VVTADQMRLLFAEGRHPLAGTSGPGASGPILALAAPPRPSAGRRRGPGGGSGAEWFLREEGGAPGSELELQSALVRWSRSAPAAVGGYDLTFSPVKSVSTLWAIADLPIAALIGQAHHSALAEALRFIEDRALFTREGRGGVRQVDVTGLVAAAFTHRDSRAGDPDLHTHVALANKVQTLDGR